MLTSVVDRVGLHADRVLVSDSSGAYTGAQLLDAAATVARALDTAIGDVEHPRIALLASPGLPFVAGLLATWMRRAMAVPLCAEHPPSEMGYVLEDSRVHAVLVDERLRGLLPATSLPMVGLPTSPGNGVAARHGGAANNLAPDTPALMLYTSGTTGRPKGVVHTHASMNAQIGCLVEAWEWNASDRIPHFLPLHHVHGLVNKLLCPLWVGARCDMFDKFDAHTVLERLADEPYTIFMAVPTVYSKAIEAWDRAEPPTRQRWSQACARLRVMISGSAALALPVLRRWQEITGHTLLERYGMTEIGIALTNPLHGDRRPGFVGSPVPGMSVRVVEDGQIVDGHGATGELEVCGPNVFAGYWQRPDETASSFSADGWFRTGDRVSQEYGAFRIVGRLSTDIIKTGGYKVSALEIESVLLGHPAILECCVVGVPDEVWGERVGAAVVLRPGTHIDLDSLREWARSELAPYKLPTLLRLEESLPRNVMGKVLKPETRLRFRPSP